MASVQLESGGNARVDVPPLFIAAEPPVVSTQGRVTADPSTQTETHTVVPNGAQVTLTWENPPALTETAGVIFYLRRTGIGAPLEIIASDTNLADGVSAQWRIPPKFEGTLIAQAEVANGLLESEEMAFITVIPDRP